MILIEGTINVIQILRKKYRCIFKYVSIKKYYSYDIFENVDFDRYSNFLSDQPILHGNGCSLAAFGAPVHKTAAIEPEKFRLDPQNKF